LLAAGGKCRLEGNASPVNPPNPQAGSPRRTDASGVFAGIIRFTNHDAENADLYCMRALSIRQPFAELILRGVKTVEYRTRPTRIIGERFHIYASLKKLPVASGQWPVKNADNIVVPTQPLSPWMIELAEQVGMIDPDAILPTGMIVGSAVIEKVEEVASDQLPVASGKSRDPSLLATNNSQLTTFYAWHLAGVERAKTFRKPKKHPQPVWFNPFD
jgi:predicted transcriptional regulator